MSAIDTGLDPGVIEERARGALLGTFVGDALGMPYEGMAPDAIPADVEMVDARRGAGTYTDDTQMMIALAESLIERGRIDDAHLARAFLDAYDPDRGYGGGTRQVFELWARGASVADAAGSIFGGKGSRGNGAAMRIAPVGVRFHAEPARLVAEAGASARLTHAHPVAIDAAVVQAVVVGAAIRGADLLACASAAATSDEMRGALRDVELLLRERPGPEEINRRLGSASDARESVSAALYSALAHDSFARALTFAVRVGGDTDTVAAMCGAVTGARDGAGSIPRRWLERLEDGERGRSHVERLAGRLCAARAT